MVPATVLITIPLSHYCEKARWALDRVALPYREEPHAPLLSRLAVLGRKGGTVPVLVSNNLRLTDSAQILAHADAFAGGDVLFPRDATLRSEVGALQARFDQHLGTQVRRWAYSHLLPDKVLLRDLWSRGVPRREAIFLPLIVPVARKLLRRAYKASPDGAMRSLDRVREVFGEVEQRLSDGRRFLVGDRFTAADLTFASLAAPALFPAQCRAVLPTLDQVPAEMRAEILRLRETPAGQFGLRMYAQERHHFQTHPRALASMLHESTLG
jgi:glutathione S-transferase